MPQVIPLVVGAVTAVTSAVVAAGPLAVAAFNAVNIAAVVGVGLAVAGPLLQPSVGTSGPTLSFKSAPSAPIRGVMGRMAVGGNEVFKRTWGKTNVYLTSVAILSLAPCDSIEAFKANGTSVSFGGAQGEATSGFFANNMWQTRSMGLPGGSALTPPTGVFNGSPALTGWTSNHKATGHVSAMWTLALAEDVQKRDMYTNGVPDPLWVGKWMKVWDPRLDSTYPGGSGPQRRDEWDTWAWTANPYLHAIAWVRGHYKLNLDGTIDRTKRIAGIGAPDRLIDLAAYVEGANVATANNWTIAGEWSTSDDKWQVLNAMLQAGGGTPLHRGAQISCKVSTPRASLYTYTRSDLIGECSIKALKPRRDRKNTIIPRYRSEAHDWEVVPAGAVSSSVYVTEDRGETRSLEIEYTYVTAAKQAGELAAYDIANMREGLNTSLPSKSHLLGLRAGDAFTIDIEDLGLNDQKVIVERRGFEPQTGTVTLDVISETDAKHAWALGQTANPPPTVSLTAYDPTVAAPDSGDWSAVGTTFTAGGASIPAIVVTGSVGNFQADGVIFEFRPVGATDWSPAGLDSPATIRKEITGLTPDTSYEVAVSYRVRGVIGARLILGPVTSGDLSTDPLATQRGQVDFSAGYGPGSALTQIAETPALTVGSSGRIGVDIAAFAQSDLDGSIPAAIGNLRLYIVKGGTETLVNNVVIADSSGTESQQNLSALTADIAHAYSGSVLLRLKLSGGGGINNSTGTLEGRLTATWYP